MTGSMSGSTGDSTAETASSSEATQDSSTGSSSEAALCGDLVDGALVEFSVHVSTLEHPDTTETLKLWLSDDAFIDEALRLFESQEQRVPNFEGLLDGQDCDSQWTWHVNAATARWLEPGEIPGGGGDEIPTDSCDGLPSAVEAQKAYWFEQVRRYCPQDAKVLSIDDRRQR